MSKALQYWAAVGWLLLTTCLGTAQTVRDPTLRLTEIVGGLNAPTAMGFIGTDDILVLQKNDGQVRRVINGVLQPTPVLDVAVDQASERGLLGIAVHPAFPSPPWVYLYYTESSTGADTAGSPEPLGNRLYRFRWDGNALVEPALLLNLPGTPGPNHDGGVLTFGPDGKLYAAIGDLNHRGQLQNVPTGPSADDTSVILRLNDDGSPPSDNPFFAFGGNLAKYYAYGIRNSFGLAFDPLTQTLWQTENGPSTYDEINIIMPGFNSGWVQIMGPAVRAPQGLDDLFQLPGSHYADPRFSWLETVAPTAIIFLNSTQLGTQYQHDMFVGDINSGNLYHFKLTSSRDGLHFDTPALAADLVADPEDDLQEIVFGTDFGGITDLKIGPDGRLYILSFLGKIFAVSHEATLQGTITDALSEGVLEGVRVTAWRLAPEPITHLHTSTDVSGAYALSRLSPGRYWVFFSRSGYRLGLRHGDLPPGQTTIVNVQLPPR